MDIFNNSDDILIKPEDFELKKELICDIVNARYYNKKIIDYFLQYKKDKNANRVLSDSVIPSLETCNKYFLVDVYMNEMIKDFKSTNLCHSKFCNNCKKVKQASRMSRYIPHIEPYKEFNHHLVLTVPSVPSKDLRATIDKMNKSFRYLIGYFSGHKKIHGIDFSQYGYLGAIKSLEITFKELPDGTDMYHPHLHTLLTLKSRGEDVKEIENIYSYSTSNGKRLFSKLEILIQKIWYLLMNEQEVTYKNIKKLDVGYSCVLDKFNDDDYIELFKYLTKDFDDNTNVLTYKNFKAIYEQTYQVKQIQGYGIYYRIIDENLDDEVEREYQSIVNFLKDLDQPYETMQRSFELLNDPYTIISRKVVYNILNQNKKNG